MWIVFEMEGTGLTDELVRVIGPFETREAAEAYGAKHGLDVMELEKPDDAEEIVGPSILTVDTLTDQQVETLKREWDEANRSSRYIGLRRSS